MVIDGDPEALPNMPFQQWLDQSPAVWALVADMIRNGYFGRVRAYYGARPVPAQWLTDECALHCQALGAPVGHFFTAAAIIVRDRVTENP